jgi:ketosteroid isomerase-like protein
MHRLAIVLLSFALASPAFAALADSPKHFDRRISSAEDIAAIKQLALDFQEAIAKRDTKQLSTLMLDTNILFTSPPNADIVNEIRQADDVTFDGLRSGGYHSFARTVRDPKISVREDFYNLNIIQDGHLAWVWFDFDFIINDKVVNHGVEAWQLLKTGDGKWKIFSVVWSSKGTPK